MKKYPEIMIIAEIGGKEIQASTLIRKKQKGVWYLYKVERVYELDHKIDVDTNLIPIIQAFHAECYKEISFGKVGTTLKVHRKDSFQGDEQERIGTETYHGFLIK